MNDTAVISYHRAMEAGDADGVTSTFADDIVIRVAVHDEPMTGISTARFLFPLLVEYFRDFRVVEAMSTKQTSVLIFRTGLADYPRQAEGVNLIRLDLEGQINDLTVFLRPLPALQAVAQHIGTRMAAQFGDLPITPGR